MSTVTKCDEQHCSVIKHKDDGWLQLVVDWEEPETPFIERYFDFCSWACLKRYMVSKAV